ncbi:MAG: biopolymer transporter ExbD [Candidatus Krumholzibacteriota bacterium]|nr:biopolymer transporter ExbD [Candidatus Krumholzibacteriota bacterium]
MRRKGKPTVRTIAEANVTPLADVVTTLIVVFLMTMPALVWSGIQVNATRAAKSREVVRKDRSTADKMMVLIHKGVIEVDGESLRMAELAELTRARMADTDDRTVILVPDDDVPLGWVVTVMDVLKQNGAESLALLNRIGGEA